MFNLTAFIGYMIAVTFTPGPNNILVMTNAGTYGFKKTFNYMMGGAIGVFINSGCGLHDLFGIQDY